jgi:UDP-glucuronate decarboxylase
LSCLTDSLSARSGANHQNQRAWRDQHAGASQAHRREDLSGLHQRGLRRPRRATAARKLLGGKVNPIGPRTCYDEGKRCAETLFFDYRRKYGMDIKVARIFNTYGSHIHPNDGRIVSNFIVQALKGERITLYGDGTQTRSFCYVDDLIEGFVRLMHKPEDFTGPVNLGNPGEFTMIELADTITALTGSKSELIHKPLPTDDPKQRQSDIRLAREVMRWGPGITLEQGLKPTIDHFEQLLSSEK